MNREWTKAQLDVLQEGNNTIVAASAGSGKTAVLIEKIFRLLQEGASLKNMAIMTFTDLAACELKERLTDKLLDAIRSGEDDGRLKSQLEYIPFADVSTIHAFCKRLYKRYYAEIAEDFYEDTLNGDEADALYKECAKRAVADMRSRNIEAFDKTYWHFYGRDRGGARLVNAIVELHRFLECVEDKDAFVLDAIRNATIPFLDSRVSGDYLADFRKRIAMQRVKLEECVEELSMDGGYKDVAEYVQILSINLLSLSQAQDLRELVQRAHTAVEAMLTPNGKAIQLKKSKIVDAELRTRLERIRESYKSLIEDIQGALGGFDDRLIQDAEAGEHVEQLLLVTQLAEDIYTETKKKEGAIDFSDLERLAVKVISDKERLAEICDGYDYVFVDEYQDTNYLQEMIVTSVAARAKAFFIGDGKQSIYRFRYAEPQIFFDRRKSYADNAALGSTKTFSHNFRSDKRILQFVNAVFEGLMTPSFGGVYYPDEAFLSGSVDFPDLSTVQGGDKLPPVVEVSVFPATTRSKASPTGEAYDIREDNSYEEDPVDGEAEYIATRIKDMQGAPIVYNPIRESFSSTPSQQYTEQDLLSRVRPIEYKDIAVLVSTHSQAKKISKVLSTRGVPNYVHSGGEGEDYKQDREFLFAYLRLLASLHDDVALAIVLLSPLTAFTEQDLLEIRGDERKKPFWASFAEYCGDQTLIYKRDGFLAMIDKHRAVAATSNVRVLVECIIKDYAYDAYIMGSDQGDERIASLNIFLESLSHIAAASDLFKFNQYVASGAKWQVTPPSGGGNAVSIMTIHASKGLEFPVVFVPYADYDGSSNGLRERDNDFIIANREYGVAIDYYDDHKKTKTRTLTGAFLASRKKRQELEERMRVMYVALTRAKNHLFVTMKAQHVKKAFAEENTTFAKWLFMAREGSAIVDGVFVDRQPQIDGGQQATISTPLPYTDNLELLDYVYPYKHETATEVKYTVTSLLQDGERGAVIETDEMEKVRLLGVAYHAVLEKIDLHKVERGDVIDTIDRLVHSGELEEAIAQDLDADLIVDILHLPVFDDARRGRVIREKDFMLYLPASQVVDGEISEDKVLVQGVIDALILGKENLLVDYKYSSLSDEKLVQKYSKQISLYKIAVEKLLKITIDRAIIVSLKTGREIRIL